MSEFFEHDCPSRNWQGTVLRDNTGLPFLVPQFLGWESGEGRTLTSPTNGRANESNPTTRLDCHIGSTGLGTHLLGDGPLDGGWWSVVVLRPGLRLYCSSVGKRPDEARYVSLVLFAMRDRMILSSAHSKVQKPPVPIGARAWGISLVCSSFRPGAVSRFPLRWCMAFNPIKHRCVPIPFRLMLASSLTRS